jgi:hypothetical protein
MWIFVLAPWTVDPGLVMLFQFLNMPAAAEFCTQPIALFLISTLVNIIALLFLVFGMKVFAAVQKVVMVLGILGGIVILLLFTFTSREGFTQAWNGVAAQYGSLDYQGFLAAAGAAMQEAGTALPATELVRHLRRDGGRLVSFAYSCITIAGQSRPTRPSSWVTCLPCWCRPSCVAGDRALSWSADSCLLAWVDNGLAGYTRWSPPCRAGHATCCRSADRDGGSFILFNLWYVALSYPAFPRIVFAWHGPHTKWFTYIDYRWAHR